MAHLRLAKPPHPVRNHGHVHSLHVHDHLLPASIPWHAPPPHAIADQSITPQLLTKLRPARTCSASSLLMDPEASLSNLRNAIRISPN